MSEKSRHQIIKHLQAKLPRGAPFDLATLRQLGVRHTLGNRETWILWGDKRFALSV